MTLPDTPQIFSHGHPQPHKLSSDANQITAVITVRSAQTAITKYNRLKLRIEQVRTTLKGVVHILTTGVIFLAIPPTHRRKSPETSGIICH